MSEILFPSLILSSVSVLVFLKIIPVLTPSILFLMLFYHFPQVNGILKTDIVELEFIFEIHRGLLSDF